MATTPTYSFTKGLTKSVINALIVGVPILIQLLPHQWMNLTIGGVALLIVNWLKNK